LRIRCNLAKALWKVVLGEIAVRNSAAKEGKVVRVALIGIPIGWVVRSCRGWEILGERNARDKAEECEETVGLGVR